MKIETGLFSKMVLQRTSRGTSDQPFSGKCKGPGVLKACIRSRGKTLRGWNWKQVGKAGQNSFKGRIQGLPVGGSYDIELQVVGPTGIVVDRAKVKDVLVGDVWVLAGQSNMEGVGYLKHALKPVRNVRAFYMTDEWDVAADPLHTLWCAIDPFHCGDPKAPRKPCPHHVGVGPGLSFGQEMLRRTGVPQGLLACAHGGTSMPQWDPALKRQGGKSLYGATLRRVRKNGGRVAGVLWYQGCSETMPEGPPPYTKRMIRLVRAMRRDFNAPRLPWAIVQISRVTATGDSYVHWNSIRDQQRLLPKVIKNCTVVPAIDLALADGIHISGFDQNRLGPRLAAAMETLRRGRKAGKPPIELKRVKMSQNPLTTAAEITVEFDNVIGRLKAEGRPNGFHLSDVPESVYRMDLEDNRVIVRTGLPVYEIEGGSLYYGYGFNPYCNICDEADRSIPAFGPVPVGTKKRAIMGFVRNLRVSRILPAANMSKLKCPRNMKSLGLAPHEFAIDFCSRHEELEEAGAALIYYACNFHCPQGMKLAVHFGYDGPTKVWLDGREIFFDPNGINPANQDDTCLRFNAAQGDHELLVALDSNNGKAWGVFLRFERLNVPERTMRNWPHGVPMPEIMQ
jgi:hypothetical protein